MSLSLAPLSLAAPTLQLRPLPSTVVTRFIGTMGRSDSHPGLTCPSRAFSWRLPPPGWVSRVALSSLRTCRRHYPGGPVAPYCSQAFDGPWHAAAAAFPQRPRGRHPHGSFSRPARRSLAVTAHLLAESPARFVDVGSFSRFVASSAVPTATGWNNQLSRTGLSPAGTQRLSRRTDGSEVVGCGPAFKLEPKECAYG